MPSVTVIIPAYNAEEYIEQCAYSLLKQTLKDIELLFIDDGSTDRTGEILDGIAVNQQGMKVVHQENKGLYKTREIGLSLASGDYIGWVDADDFVEDEMFETLYNTAITNDSELVICDYSWYPERISMKEKWFREYKGVVDTRFVERNSQPWNKIVKKELLERLGIEALFTKCFDEIYIRVLMEAKNPITINKALYNYRVSAGSMSTSYSNVNHYWKFVEASRALRDVVGMNNNSYWADYFTYRIIYYLLITMIVAANSDDRNSYIQGKKELFEITPIYFKNQHFWRILTENYGVIKAVVIGAVVPSNYALARLACKIGMK